VCNKLLKQAFGVAKSWLVYDINFELEDLYEMSKKELKMFFF